MAKVFGFAFSSPTVVIPAIDKDKFSIYLFEGLYQDIVTFLELSEKKVVVLVKELLDLKIVIDLPAHAFIVFDDPATLRAILGIEVLDCLDNTDSGDNTMKLGWSKINLKPAHFNSLLESYTENETRVVISSELISKIEKKLEKPATLQEIVKKVNDLLQDQTKVKDINRSVCEFVAGVTAGTPAWTSKIAKPIKTNSVTLDSLIELERYMNSKEKEALWRAYHDHVSHGLTLANSAKRYKQCVESDLSFLIDILKPTPEMKYVFTPKNTVFKE